MGLLDDVLGSAVPGGNLAKPLIVGLAALLGARAVGSGLGGLLGGTGAAPQTPSIPSPTPTAAPGQPQGGLLGGLSSLLQSFQQNGHGDTANSWVSQGPNKQISPGDLANALGSDQINHLISQSGLSREELLSGLSQQLPDVINHLTPDGRLPTGDELSDRL